MKNNKKKSDQSIMHWGSEGARTNDQVGLYDIQTVHQN